MIFWRLRPVRTHAYNPAHARSQVSNSRHLEAGLSSSGWSVAARVRQPTEGTTGKHTAPTALRRCQPTHHCLSLVSLLGSVVGLTLGINLVGAALKSISAATISAIIDVSVQSVTRCSLLPFEMVR